VCFTLTLNVSFLHAFSKNLDCMHTTTLWAWKVWPSQVMVRSVYSPLVYKLAPLLLAGVNNDLYVQ
jgi:hypothetical protein